MLDTREILGQVATAHPVSPRRPAPSGLQTLEPELMEPIDLENDLLFPLALNA